LREGPQKSGHISPLGKIQTLTGKKSYVFPFSSIQKLILLSLTDIQENIFGSFVYKSGRKSKDI